MQRSADALASAMPVPGPAGLASGPPRRVVLVSLDWIRPKDPRTSLGHASLLARLATVPGVEARPVSFAVNDPLFRRDAVLSAILERATEARTDVAIGAYVWNEPVVQWLLPALRWAGFAGRIILGGPQISYAPAGIDATYPDADVFIRGYAEDALAAIVATDDRIPVPGVSWHGHDLAPVPAQVDLTRLPSPILAGVVPPHPFMRWETQRGCPYTCKFCQHREPGARLRRRALAPERVAAEIDWLARNGVRDIAVLDPLFNSNPAAADILGRFAHAGFAGRLSLQCRFEDVDDEFLDSCRGLDVRLEFGLQTVHPAEMRAAGRVNHLGRVESVIAALHGRAIPFEVSLIYGLPEQTLASFEASVRWCQERAVSVVRAFPLMLLRGTELHRDRARWDLVESVDPIPVVVASNTFTRAEWEAMRAGAEALEPATVVAA